MPIERPIQSIINHLTASGKYRPLSMPLTISSIEFDIPGAVVGVDGVPDLVLIAQLLNTGDSAKVQRRVEGVARALDLARSTRPLTTILAGPQPDAMLIKSLSKICRTLPVTTLSNATFKRDLDHWVSVLLPLNLIVPGGDYNSIVSTFLEKLAAHEPESFARKIWSVSSEGSGAVERELREHLAKPTLISRK